MNLSVQSKLKSRIGESIAETLVAVLIAAFALLMLAGTVNTSSNLVINSRNKLNEYYEYNNKVESRDNEVAETETEEVSLIGTNKKWHVKIYENNKMSKSVIAYDNIS